MELKEIVKTRREALGLTQKQVAELTGCMGQETIAFLESGRNKSTKWLPELAEALELTIDQIRGIDIDRSKLTAIEKTEAAIRRSGVSLEKLTKSLYEALIGKEKIKSKLSAEDAAEKIARVAIAIYIQDQASAEDYIKVFYPEIELKK